MSFKMDDVVKIKFTLLTGVVKGAKVDEVTLDMVYLVEYNDNTGEPQARYFKVDELEAA